MSSRRSQSTIWLVIVGDEMHPRGEPTRMTSHILIPCPNCSHALKVRSEYMGRRGTCKHCQAEFILEAPKEPLTRPATVEANHGTGTAFWEPKPADPDQPSRSDVDRLKHDVSSLTKERDALQSELESTRANLADVQTTIEHFERLSAEHQLTCSDSLNAARA